MVIAIGIFLLGGLGYGILLRMTGGYSDLGQRSVWYPAILAGLGLCLAVLAYAPAGSFVYYCAFAGVCLSCAALPVIGFSLRRKAPATEKTLHGSIQAVIGAAGGILSFTISYLLVTELWMDRDFVWITLRLVLPIAVLTAVFDTIEGFSPKYLFVGAAVQYGLLIAFAEPLFAFLFQGDLHSGFFASRWPEYLGAAFPYPALVTLGQFLLVCILRFRKRK